MTIGRRCQRGIEGDPSRSSNPREKDDMKEQCEMVDTRYEVWDSISEAELFVENGVPTSGRLHCACGNLTRVLFKVPRINWSPVLFWGSYVFAWGIV